MAANPPRSITICHVLTGTEGRRRHKCPSQSAPSFNFSGKITRNACAPVSQAPLGTGRVDQLGGPGPASQSATFRAQRTGARPGPGAALPLLQTPGSRDALRASDSLAFHPPPCPPPRLSPTHPPFGFSSDVTPCGKPPPTSAAWPVTTLGDDVLPCSHSRTGATDRWRPRLCHLLALLRSRGRNASGCSRLWNSVCMRSMPVLWEELPYMQILSEISISKQFQDR